MWLLKKTKNGCFNKLAKIGCQIKTTLKIRSSSWGVNLKRILIVIISHMIKRSWWRRKPRKVLSFISISWKRSLTTCLRTWENHSKDRVLIVANQEMWNRKLRIVSDRKLLNPKRYSLRSTSIQVVTQTKNRTMITIITAWQTLQ